jgi:hypothetical protein
MASRDESFQQASAQCVRYGVASLDMHDEALCYLALWMRDTLACTCCHAKRCASLYGQSARVGMARRLTGVPTSPMHLPKGLETHCSR